MTNRSEAAKRGGQTQRARGEKLRRKMTLAALNHPGTRPPMGGKMFVLESIEYIRKILDDLERSLQ